MRKRLIIISLVLVVMVLLSGCTGRTIRGTGDMVSRTFQFDNFSALNLNVPFIVIWQEGQQTSVAVEMQENLFEHLQVFVQGGALFIESRRQFEVNPPNIPRIYITSPQLVELSSNAAISTEGWDMVSTEKFAMNLSGGAIVNVPLNVNLLEINIDDGGAYLTLTGSANNTNIVIEGGVNISALDLQTANSRIELTGGGIIDIAVSDTLDVTINGAGFIRYRGNPIVNRNITGFGTVSSID